MPIQLACSTVCFRTSPVQTALEEIRAAGFTAIDLAVIPGFCPHFDAATAKPAQWNAFARLVRDSGLTVPTTTSVPGHFNAPGADFDRIVKAGYANVRLARELDAAAVNLHCGLPIEDRSKFREHSAVQARGLKKIARHAADMGTRVNLEAPHRNGLCRTLDEAEILMDEIGEENVDYLLDVTHVQAAKARPEVAVRRFAERIGHVHLRDGKGQNIFLTPGDGDINFSSFFAALDKADYSGWCALELEGPGESLEERRANLRRALDYLLDKADVATGLDFTKLAG